MKPADRALVLGLARSIGWWAQLRSPATTCIESWRCAMVHWQGMQCLLVRVGKVDRVVRAVEIPCNDLAGRVGIRRAFTVHAVCVDVRALAVQCCRCDSCVRAIKHDISTPSAAIYCALDRRILPATTPSQPGLTTGLPRASSPLM